MSSRNRSPRRPPIVLALLLTITASAAAFAADASIVVDAAHPAHTISPLLFGDQVQWPGFGQDLLEVTSTSPVTMQLRNDIIDPLRGLGITMLRFPGGTLSDVFHWQQTTGPYTSRVPQTTLDLESGSTFQYQVQPPFFGVDEFTETARRMNAEMMITANVGTGTASEAAAWLSYLKSKGIRVKYWEIGNEVYLDNSPLEHSFHKTAAEYAAAFDAFAAALRAVDPTIQVGLLGTDAAIPTWNQTVLTSITQKADFMAIHSFYAPGDVTLGESTARYQATLAAPDYFEQKLAVIKQDIQAYASPMNRSMALAVTEHAPFFLFPPGSTSAPDIEAGVARNQTLAAALFSALSYHVMMQEPQIAIANHINPVSYLWQAMLTVRRPNIPGFVGYDASQPSYPIAYRPDPLVSAFGHVFRLYAESAGGQDLPVAISGSPTFDTTLYATIPALTGVRSLEAIAVRSAKVPGRTLLYVVNRDLSRDVASAVTVTGLTTPLARVTVERLSGTSPAARVTHETPNVVTLAASSLAPKKGFVMTFPSGTLTRITFDENSGQTLDQVSAYPNPLRPAQGHQAMTFSGLPAAESRVRIYSLSGELVRSLEGSADGQALWDGLNAGGKNAASGVYFARIEAGGQRRTIKIAIQR